MLARAVAGSAVWLAALTLGGCLDYREILEIRPDGSGRIELIQEVDRETYDQIVDLAASFDSSDSTSLPRFDEETLRENLADREGLTVETIEIEDLDEGRIRRVRIVLEFDRPDRLRSDDRDLALLLRPFTLDRQTGDDPASFTFRRRIGIEPKDLESLIEDNRDEADLEFDNDQVEGFRTLASQILLGKKAVFTVRMPGTISSASPEGTKIESETATWTFPLSDLFARTLELELKADGSTPPTTGEGR